MAVVSDVKTKNGDYLFTDGIGIINSEVAAQMARKLHIYQQHGVPSSFQMRIGGAKGMLTVWDEAIPKNLHENVHVVLRESMTKFDCDHYDIEVVGYSKRLPLYLNRQIIMLLSGHGVPDWVFLSLQRKILRQLDEAMGPEGQQAALALFQTNTIDRGHRMESADTGIGMASFFRAGLTCGSCEFLFNMMYAYRLRTIGEIMSRGRIPMGASSGLCAIGVVDELGVLGPREVFCQFKHPSDGKIRVVEGPVTVGRSPCHHPGDIQPLDAVRHPQLMHLVDVIVFPKKGERPIPSMLSGGDLDGDIFFCIFDESFELPDRSPIVAMDYTPPIPVALDRPVTHEDVADFFVEYIENDVIGMVANAHVVQADKQLDGIFSHQCLELAQLHSLAVDFPKTGVSARRKGRNLFPGALMNAYPDFMGKHPKVGFSFVHRSVLNRLSRICCNFIR